MLEAYRKHVEERAAEGVPPKPLTEQQVADLVELLKTPPAGEEEFIQDLFVNRVPPGVDQAAYVKAAFLTAIVKGEASSPLIDRKRAVQLLGTMQGGYNVATLVEALDDAELAEMGVAIGNWRMFSELLQSLQIPLEPGIAHWPPDGTVPPSAKA